MLDVETHNVVLMQIIYVAQSMWSCTPLALMALQKILCGPINFRMLCISIIINYHGYECLWIDVAISGWLQCFEGGSELRRVSCT